VSSRRGRPAGDRRAHHPGRGRWAAPSPAGGGGRSRAWRPLPGTAAPSVARGDRCCTWRPPTAAPIVPSLHRVQRRR